MFQDLIQDSTLHLIVMSPYFPLSVTVLQSYLVFHDIVTFKEYRSVILYNVSPFGFVWYFFLIIRLKLWTFVKQTKKVMLGPPQGIMSESTLWWCLNTSVNFEHLPGCIFIERAGRKQPQSGFDMAAGNSRQKCYLNWRVNNYEPSYAMHEMYHFIKIY